jgi:hypothetical protein
MRMLVLAVLGAFLFAGCSSGSNTTEREDDNSVNVPAGRGLEFKFYLQAGHPLE